MATIGRVRPRGVSASGAQAAIAPWLTLTVLCSSILIVNLDNTVLNVALPTVVRELRATSGQLQWIVDAYALVFGGLLLVAGSLADRVGRKWTFLSGLAAFAAGSAWAAFSGSVNVLIAARASMGVGAALMMPSTLAIITEVFSDATKRQRAIGIWAGTTGVGFALGPIVGGLLLDHFWWGAVFLINVPIAALAFACAVPWVPNSNNAAALRPDLVGAAFSISGVGLILWSIIEGPVKGWTSVLVLAPGGAGLLILAAFVVSERVSSHPMLKLGFFRNRSFSVAICITGLVAFGLVGGLFLLTQYLQFDLGYSPLDAGIRMVPIAAALAVISPLSAVLNRFLGTKLTTAAGMLLVATGTWLVSGGTVAWTFVDMLPGMILIGIGAALVMPSVSASVMSSLPRGDTGVGAATNGASIQIGGALGVALIGSLLSTRYQDRMNIALANMHPPLPPAVHDAILGSVGGALEIAQRLGGLPGTVLAAEARSAFISGADIGLVTAAAVAAAGFIVALAALPARQSRTRG